jgi:hypothetical protein
MSERTIDMLGSARETARTWRRGVAAAIALAALGAVVPARAAGGEAEGDASKDAARAHFEKGLRLLDERAFDGALAEFRLSNKLYGTRSAAEDAAVCLRELHRFDEALEAYEGLLRAHADLPPDVKKRVDAAVTELQGLVGTLDVTAAEAGASIVVDSRDRGTTPPATPIRVGAGTHVVRVSKAGFTTFETRVELAGGQTVAIRPRLERLARAGSLRVVASDGRVIDVVVDDVVVGKTPWTGVVAPGEHAVQLRGGWGDGSPPTLARVDLDRTTELPLAVVELEGALRVKADPLDAIVSVDGVPVGHGGWEGRLVKGEHRVTVTAPGFAGVERTVRLEPHAPVALDEKLAPATAQPAGPSGHVAIELWGAGTFAPTLGGDVAGACSAPCTATFAGGEAVALGVGWQAPNGLGVGLTAGTARLVQETTARSGELAPVGKPPSPGKIDDRLVLHGVTLGLAGSYRLAAHRLVPITFRLSAGALLGELVDTRAGTFRSSKGTAYDPGVVVDSPAARYVHVTPEIRAGVRLTDHLTLEGGMQAMVLVAATRPAWTNDRALPAAEDGLARYAGEALTAKVVVVLEPGAAMRWDF